MVNRWQAPCELLLATSIWGFGFIATIWALQSFDAVSVTFIRFGGSFLIGCIWFYFSPLKREFYSKLNFLISAVPGLLIGLMLALQTWGLQYTSATNSGFITTLYVVFVPLFESLFFRTKITKHHFFWVITAIVGTGLMTGLSLNLNKGDFLTLCCAMAGALHFIWIGKISSRIKSAFAFNSMQCLWASIAGFLIWPFYESLYIEQIEWKPLLGLFSITIGSTLIAFGLQVRAQKILPASTVSVVCLLESPFAALFAVLLIGELIVFDQVVGASLILLASYAVLQINPRSDAKPK